MQSHSASQHKSKHGSIMDPHESVAQSHSVVVVVVVVVAAAGVVVVDAAAAAVAVVVTSGTTVVRRLSDTRESSYSDKSESESSSPK